MHAPRFSEITTLAYKELLRCNAGRLPIRHMKFTDNMGKPIILVSFQDYIRLCGETVRIEDLTLGADFNDGYALKDLRADLRLILYNAKTNPRRLWFTIYHEVGHFKCGHNKHGDTEEIEAHFFASQLLMPNAVIRFLAEHRYAIHYSFLMDCFGVSAEAAKKKMDYLSNYGYHLRHPYDEALIRSFQGDLERRYPLLNHVGLAPAKSYYGGDFNFASLTRNEQLFIDPDY